MLKCFLDVLSILVIAFVGGSQTFQGICHVDIHTYQKTFNHLSQNHCMRVKIFQMSTLHSWAWEKRSNNTQESIIIGHNGVITHRNLSIGHNRVITHFHGHFLYWFPSRWEWSDSCLCQNTLYWKIRLGEMRNDTSDLNWAHKEVTSPHFTQNPSAAAAHCTLPTTCVQPPRDVHARPSAWYLPAHLYAVFPPRYPVPR